MSKKILFCVAIIVCGFALAGCRSSTPVYNVKDSLVQGYDKKLSQAQVEKAIIDAASGLKWQLKKVKPGLILATVLSRGHSAVIEIKYSDKAYSIDYKSSENLNYDGTNIHQTYNGWIKNLDAAIKNKLIMQ